MYDWRGFIGEQIDINMDKLDGVDPDTRDYAVFLSNISDLLDIKIKLDEVSYED